MDIGGRLKDIRQQKGLTQAELADRSELSKGFISQVENNRTCPTIATLSDILECLGTDLGEFFSQSKDRRVVYQPEDMFEKQSPGRKIEWLVPSAQKNRMEPIRLTLEPGASSDPDLPHEGEEFGCVIQGTVTLCLGARRYEIGEGGTFYFEPDVPHSVENTGQGTAVLVWVTDPPNF